jgi:ubiquinol-cytochrome c reductase cytochrome b subunit
VSLFFIGIILLVFAAFFHVYRYAMSQQKNAPPPAPVPVVEEKPKLPEPEVSAETSKLPEGQTTSDTKPDAKELAPEVPAPKTQADLGVGADANAGSTDFDGVKKL